MSEQEMLALYLVGGFVIFVIAVNILFKLLGIKIKERGAYYKAYLQVAENFNLTELDLSFDERYAKVDHIERLHFSRVSTKKIVAAFEGYVQGIKLELFDIKKYRYPTYETLVMADFHHHETALRFQCTLFDSSTGAYTGYEVIHSPQLGLSKRFKGKDPENPIWHCLSTDDLARLNELPAHYRVFEVIIENGKFNFLMERQSVNLNPEGFKFFEADCRTFTLIVELALELRDMFANAAATLELESS